MGNLIRIKIKELKRFIRQIKWLTKKNQNKKMKQITMNKKKKFVADGVFNAELNSFL